MFGRACIFFFMAAGLALATPLLAQTTRYVDVLNGSDQGNTCSNASAPCQTIVHAIDVSFGGDIIQIAEGLYTESFEIDKPLSLHGAGETTTIIQAHSQPGQASGRVISIDVTFGVEIEITDLTIRHGNAVNIPGGGLFSFGATLSLTNVSFIDNYTGFWGGGMRVSSSPATLTNVSFTGNQAAAWAGGLSDTSSNPSLNDVSFSGNFAAELGGGMHNANSSPSLTNVSFSNNEAGESGGGVYNSNSNPTMSNVSFSDNQASGSDVGQGGGGMFVLSGAPTLLDVSFEGNTALRGGALYIDEASPDLRNLHLVGNAANIGGGVYVEGGTPMFSNVLFNGNLAALGGAMYMVNSATTMTNATIAGNMAVTNSGGLTIQGTSVATLRNTIIWGNTSSDGANEMMIWDAGTAELIHSLYADGLDDIFAAGTFNADANSLTDDPLYVDLANQDLRLSQNSPAIDTGEPGTDLTLFPGGPTNPVDLDNQPRVVGSLIDLGAYEWQPLVDEIFKDRFAP